MSAFLPEGIRYRRRRTGGERIERKTEGVCIDSGEYAGRYRSAPEWCLPESLRAPGSVQYFLAINSLPSCNPVDFIWNVIDLFLVGIRGLLRNSCHLLLAQPIHEYDEACR